MAKKSGVKMLSLEMRRGRGSRESRRLRRQGRVPGVIGRRGTEGQVFTVSAHDLALILASERSMIDVELDGQQEKALIREVQFDPLGKEILHLDLERVSLDETLTVEVPLRLKGTPVGLKEGGILLKPMNAIRVECLPAQIPEQVELDVSALGVGQHLALKHLSLPAGVTVVGEPEAVVVTVTYPEREEDEAPPPEETAEPEVIRDRRPAEAEQDS